MGKNYRRLKREPHELLALEYGWSSNSSWARRKINRGRYKEQAEYKAHVKSNRTPAWHPADGMVTFGKGLKLSSTRRFINYHHRNFY